MATIPSRDTMESGLGFEIIDIRRFEAQDFAALLEAEAGAWRDGLRWDFTSSMRVISNCLREKRLLGYALVSGGRIHGYCFYFYDGEKGLIGDLFVENTSATLDDARRFLEHVVETIVATPGLRRVEAQLPHFSYEQLEPCFHNLSFAGYRRRFMALSLDQAALPGAVAGSGLPPSRPGDGAATEFLVVPWERRYDREAAEVLYDTYRQHVDAAINDQYSSVAGTTRLIENIVHHQGCGEYLPKVSRVALHAASQCIAGLLAITALRPRTAHIPQIAVARPFQDRGVGTLLMASAFKELAARGYSEISLTVTDENQGAVRLYERLRFDTFRVFGAFVFNRS